MTDNDKKKVDRKGVKGLSLRDKKNLFILIGIGVAAVVLLVVVIILLGEKAGRDETVPPTPIAEIEEAVVEEEEEETLPIPKGSVSPLTGTYIRDSWAKKRPVALMIENTRMSLPQYGLSKCGIIYECPVEGGITRLMGISDTYHKLKQFGNIRSCRPYYVYLANEYDAIYAHVGQSVHGEAVLKTGVVSDINAMDGAISNTVFYRTGDKKAPHNCFTDGSRLDQGIATKGFQKKYKKGYKPHFSFSDEDKYHDSEAPGYTKNSAAEGEKCEVVKPYFLDNKPSFVYNKKKGLYMRYQFGDKQIDALTGKQVGVKNIILYTTGADSTRYAGTEYLNLTLSGEGEGKYICGGRMIDITWKRASETERTKFYDKDGDELILAPGNTWICLIERQHMDENKYYKSKDLLKNNY